jgi:Fur family ferric uptake transcriptional regulator
MILVTVTEMTPTSTNQLRMTRQRQVILEALLASHGHPTGDEVYRLARRRLSHISLGTVYRNLEVLSEAGLVRKLELGGTARRFDAKMEEHHHIRCLRCGKVDDISVEPAAGIEQEVARQSGYEVVEHRLELIGYCPQCRKLREGKPPRGGATGKERT